MDVAAPEFTEIAGIAEAVARLEIEAALLALLLDIECARALKPQRAAPRGTPRLPLAA